MIAYVASKSARPEWALDPDNIIQVCVTGPSPGMDAREYARNETKDTDLPCYVYAVEIAPKGYYKIQKEVTFHPSE